MSFPFPRRALTVLGALAALLTAVPAAALDAASAMAAPAHTAADLRAKKQFDLLAAQYYDALARFDPLGATENGDSRYNDQLGLPIAPRLRARQFALYRGYAQRLRAIPRDGLGPRDQVNYDVLAFDLATALRFEHLPEHLLPLNQMDSAPVTLANFASGQGGQPLTSVKEYRA